MASMRMPPNNPFMRRAPVTNTGRAAGAFGARPNPAIPTRQDRINEALARPNISGAGFQRAFDDFGMEVPIDDSRHPDYAARMSRIAAMETPPPTPPSGPAFKKGGVVKAKPKAAAPVKKKAGGMIAKPKGKK